MKTLKKIIAVIICIAAISGLCVTGAFAYDTGEKENFVFSDSSVGDYFYVGEVFEGENSIEYKEEYDFCKFFAKFEVKEKGYYSITGGTYSVFELQGSEMKEIETEVYSEHAIFACFEEGTYYFTDDFYGSSPEPHDVCISIEFLGEFTGVSYNKDAFKNAVAYEDVDIYNEYLLNADPGINFTEGYLEYGIGWLGFESEKKLALGENTVTFNILDYEFTETLTIIEATDFIEKIEVENAEQYAVRRCCYDGETVYDSVYPEELKITFTDGTTRTVEGKKEDDLSDNLYYSFEHSNGRIYHIYVDVYSDGFKVMFGGHEYIGIKAEYTEASFKDNCNRLLRNILEISADFGSAVNKYISIMEEIKEFCVYYISSISIF